MRTLREPETWLLVALLAGFVTGVLHSWPLFRPAPASTLFAGTPLAIAPRLAPTKAAPPIAAAVTRARLDSLQCDGPVLVVKTLHQRFFLYDAQGRLVRVGPCSTGSDTVLVADGGRAWHFSTPHGLRRVAHKAENPVWDKPDWAFIEEGLPPPPAGAPERQVRGMLGQYALDIGGGVFVHGSPFRVTIGQPVTHGCVRLLDADLECVYHTLAVGDCVWVE